MQVKVERFGNCMNSSKRSVYCIKEMFLYCYLDTPKKNQGGINYYQHFQKDLKPYGLTVSKKPSW